MSRRYIARNPARPFSDAVLVDDRTLYLSGRIGLKPGVDAVPDAMEEEAHLVMQDVRSILELAGMKLADLVFLQVFCPDVSLWARFNKIYAEYVTAPMPPRSFVGSGPLLFGARFELQGIAVRDEEANA